MLRPVHFNYLNSMCTVLVVVTCLSTVFFVKINGNVKIENFSLKIPFMGLWFGLLLTNYVFVNIYLFCFSTSL